MIDYRFFSLPEGRKDGRISARGGGQQASHAVPRSKDSAMRQEGKESRQKRGRKKKWWPKVSFKWENPTTGGEREYPLPEKERGNNEPFSP